ncbi:signal peptidase I [Paraliobacillus ryukyuensis]|uniref:signal peptidase I n=1 Tax=Paraliobacillus ryukyuensis TaxID=200904 RepID=UPI0009A8A667|nr:signal peptidase I [Paraliobacillus ryukyuensis]
MTKKKSEWLDWLKALLIATVLVYIVRTFLFTPIVVEGPSMQPNLHNGDHMIVNKINYALSEPDRFDIVIFHATERRDYIKRVIGLPGETVDVKDDTLYINGKQVEEPFLQEKKDSLAPDETYTVDFSMSDIPGNVDVIPPEHVLVLGDNRGNSTDSRMIGLISYDQIVGSASFIYWPLSHFGLVND